MKIKFYTNVVAVLSFFTLISSPVKAVDVFGKDSNFIKVVENSSKDAVSFSYCSLKGAAECRQIGKEKFYSKAKLIALRSSEEWDVFKAIGADVVLVAATAVSGGALAYGAALNVGAAASIYGTAGGVAAGGFVGISAAELIDAINPYEQHMQTKTLADNVLNDSRVDIDYDVYDFYLRLEAVLDNL